MTHTKNKSVEKTARSVMLFLALYFSHCLIESTDERKGNSRAERERERAVIWSHGPEDLLLLLTSANHSYVNLGGLVKNSLVVLDCVARHGCCSEDL